MVIHTHTPTTHTGPVGGPSSFQDLTLRIKVPKSTLYLTWQFLAIPELDHTLPLVRLPTSTTPFLLERPGYVLAKSPRRATMFFSNHSRLFRTAGDFWALQCDMLSGSLLASFGPAADGPADLPGYHGSQRTSVNGCPLE